MSREDSGKATNSTTAKKDKTLSCAECRRLKLKCDRIFPCSSCRKRGVAALCPNAALLTKPRTNYAETAQSKMKNSEMTARIHELEEALRSLHAQHSLGSHPLLTEAERSRTTHSESSASRPGRSASPAEQDLDAESASLATLTLNRELGRFGFLGQNTGMESPSDDDPSETDSTSPPPPLGWPSNCFDPLRDYILDPLYPQASDQAIMEHLKDCFPAKERAWALCDLYFCNAAWLYSPISRPEFERVLLSAYETTTSEATYLDKSIIFAVFSIGSLLDLASTVEVGKQAPDTHSRTGGNLAFEQMDPVHAMNSEAERYYQLAQVALSAGPSVIEVPSIAGVRSLFLMAFYHMLVDRKETPHSVWSLTSIAVGIASSIAIAIPGTGNWMVRLWSNDCLSFGKPPQITLKFVDCELGADPEQTVGADGEIQYGYRHRIKLIASTILSELRDFVLSTKPPKYRDVLALDGKLRNCAVDLFGGPVGGHKVGPEVLRGHSSTETMQRFFLLALKETMVMYLHRKYFVRACMSPPGGLVNNRYFPSLLAAFRSSQVIIILMGSLLALESELPRRFWFFWNHTLASAIMMGSVAIRHPRSVLAADAMQSLETVLGQLQQWTQQSDRHDRPTKALKIVKQLHERARWAVSQPDAPEAVTTGPPTELSILGGHARVLSVKPATPHTSASSGSSGKISPSSDVHPALMEDMMQQQSLDPHGVQGNPLSESMDAMAHPASNSPIGADLMPHYGHSGYILDMDFDLTEGSSSHYYETGEALAGNVPVVGTFGVGSTGQNWMEDELSWQGFVAELGVAN